MAIPSASVLLVDDDPDVLLTLGMVLENAGYTVATAADAAHALHLAAETDFHVAVVGYRLHGSSMYGLQLITRLHDANPLTVSLLITAHDKCEVGFRAAQVGAFGYLAKPFSNKALLDAVRAALDERLRRERMRHRLHVGDPSTGLVIDLAARTVTVAGELVSISCLEFDLLAHLARHPRRAVSYDELWRKVWDYDGPPDKGVIQRAVSRLREKLGGEWIVCVRRRGYRLQ
jgi:DNA-binding response OmpR family regulator